MLFSVNKMLRSLSNAGRGFCVGRSRVSREIWVADFAMFGWVELAQMCGYLSAGAVRSTPWCGGGVVVRCRAVVVLVRADDSGQIRKRPI